MSETQAAERLARMVPRGKPVMMSWPVDGILNFFVAEAESNDAAFGEGPSWEAALEALDAAQRARARVRLNRAMDPAFHG